MLPKESVIEFKNLYLEHYKVELSDAEATFRANNLFSLFEAVYGEVITNNKNETHERHEKDEGSEETRTSI